MKGEVYFLSFTQDGIVVSKPLVILNLTLLGDK